VVPSPEILRPQNINILAKFRKLYDLIASISSMPQHSENGITNYGHSCSGILYLVYLAPKTAKIGLVLTHSVAIRVGIATHLIWFDYYFSPCLQKQLAGIH